MEIEGDKEAEQGSKTEIEGSTAEEEEGRQEAKSKGKRPKPELRPGHVLVKRVRRRCKTAPLDQGARSQIMFLKYIDFNQTENNPLEP